MTDATETCPVCDGVGTQSIEIEKWPPKPGKPAVTTSTIPCIGCDHGRVSAARRRELDFARDMWCQCPEPDYGGAHHDNGQAPWEWCVGKHHAHCGLCEKLTQIG